MKKGWLLFFYSVPAKPVKARAKIWRNLLKAGAVPLKGAGYVLPDSDENYELFQWLTEEAASMKGEAAFVRAGRIETMSDKEVIAAFRAERERDYRRLEKDLEDVERRVGSIRKGTRAPDAPALEGRLRRLEKIREAIGKIEFFPSQTGAALKSRIKALREGLDRFQGVRPLPGPMPPAPRRAGDYRGKTWVTRKKPFVDRMASAWLIRRFIDPKAAFAFVAEEDIGYAGKGSVTFDVRGGEFTHTGDLCTFEVLTRAFGIRDRAVKTIAGIVHDLDIRDGKFGHGASAGVEEILRGIRKTVSDDGRSLERGMAVFEMLYASFT